MYEINQTVKLTATTENTHRRYNLIPVEMTGCIVAVEDNRIEVELSDESWAQCDEKAKSLKLVKRFVRVFFATEFLKPDFEIEIVAEATAVSETPAPVEAPAPAEPMSRTEWNAVQNFLGPSLPEASYEEYLENLRKVDEQPDTGTYKGARIITEEDDAALMLIAKAHGGAVGFFDNYDLPRDSIKRALEAELIHRTNPFAPDKEAEYSFTIHFVGSMYGVREAGGGIVEAWWHRRGARPL